MTQPFSYYGGKQRMAHNIIPLIPKHTVYVEPFAGGASIFFNKPFPKVTNCNYYREILNDTNKLIYNFYKQLRDKPDELIRLCSSSCYSKEFHSESIEICKEPERFQALTVACAFWYNINTSFSNVLNKGFGRGVYGRNLAYTFYTKLENLPLFMDRMQGVTVENVDALICIDKWDAPQSFFYCDPPYVDTDQGHYAGYTVENLQALVDKLSKIKGSFLLSCYDSDKIVIPTDWERFIFEQSMSAKGNWGKNRDATQKSERTNTKRTEVVYRKINRDVRPEIQKIYESEAFNCYV